MGDGMVFFKHLLRILSLISGLPSLFTHSLVLHFFAMFDGSVAGLFLQERFCPVGRCWHLFEGSHCATDGIHHLQMILMLEDNEELLGLHHCVNVWSLLEVRPL